MSRFFIKVFVAASCLLSCAHTDTGRWKAAGFCVGEQVLRAALAATVRLISAPPAGSEGYAAFGREMAGAYGPGAVRCAAEALLAEPAPVVAVVVEPERRIGFQPEAPTGGTHAGPEGGAGAGVGGSVTTSATTAGASRAAATWLLANPGAWE